MEAGQCKVRKLYSYVGLQDGSAGIHDQQLLNDLNNVTFKDQRWQNALCYLAEHGYTENPAACRALLAEGAKAWGFWTLSDLVLDALLPHIMSDTELGPSRRCTCFPGEDARCSASSASSVAKMPRTFRALRDARVTVEKGDDKLRQCGFFGIFEAALILAVIAISIAYGYHICYVVSPGVTEAFGFAIFIAKAASMAISILTGFSYLTMARRFINPMYNCLPHGGFLVRLLLDRHKELHVFIGVCICLFSVVHIVAHSVSTSPGLHFNSPENINKLLRRSEKSGLIPHFSSNYQLYIQTVPGITGLILTALLALMAYTSRKAKRAKNFECFMYTHYVVLVLWPVVLYLHGSQQWLGIGVPLILICGIVPIALCLIGWLPRLFGCACGKRANIGSVVVREGKPGSTEGALVQLQIRKPSFWRFKPGMYAFLCVPELAPGQWHPFTVSSGLDDVHVEMLGFWSSSFRSHRERESCWFQR